MFNYLLLKCLFKNFTNNRNERNRFVIEDDVPSFYKKKNIV